MRFILGHAGRGMDRSKPWKTDRYRVEDRGYTTPCWTWLMKKHAKTGYGTVKVTGRDWLAHRWHYEQAKGPIPAGLQIDHLCRHRDCVNPDHLEAVTRQENVRRGKTSKLSAADALVIQRLAQEGYSAIALGKAFGVNRETVRLIRERGAEATRR